MFRRAKPRRATMMPASTMMPPMACSSPTGSLSTIQASRAATTGCNSNVSDEKAGGRKASA